MHNLQESLFRIVNSIVEDRIKKIKSDKTIECIISDDSEAALGNYKARYQDLVIPVYSTSGTTRYKVDDNVLVTVPGGDMSAKKTIVSSTKNEGEVYVDVDDVINRVGVNFVDEAPTFEINMATNQASLEVPFKMKKDLMVAMYTGQKQMLIGAEIESSIDPRLAANGDYGFEIECRFVGLEQPYTFSFRLGDMTGNPYASRGYKYLKIPLLENTLSEVISAKAYCRNISDPNGYIRIKKLEVEYIRTVEVDKSPYTGNILTPKGNYFKSGVLEPTEFLPMIMEFKREGSVLDTKDVTYEWYEMDASITLPTQPGYNPNAGPGWKQLLIETGEIKGIATKEASIRASYVPNFKTFKSVAVYKENKASAQVTLIDNTDVFLVEVDSSNGTSFKNGTGNTTLTTTITKDGLKFTDDKIVYKWTKVGVDGKPILVKEGKENSIVVQASDIGVKTNYICEVILVDRNLASGSITLINVVDGTTNSLVVTGGFRTVLYKEDGYEPDGFVADVFNFDLYRNGEKVDKNTLTCRWIIPEQTKTLLVLNNTNATTDPNGDRVTTDKTLSLGIERVFTFDKMKNVIELEVGYYDETNTLIYTNTFVTVSITKVGASGSQGQDGSSYTYEIQGGNPSIVYPNTGILPETDRQLPPFNLVFYTNGIEESNKVHMVKWSIPKNSIFTFKDSVQKYIYTYGDESASLNPHTIILIADTTWSAEKTSNYVQAEITRVAGGPTYITYFPVAVSKNGSDGEMGLTITTNPSSYMVDSEADGNIVADVSILVNFDVYKNNNKIENFTISSFANVPIGMEASIVDLKKLNLVFLKGRDLPDNGFIEVNLLINGATYRQSFSYSKARQGETPYTLIVSSTNGLLFKDGLIETVIFAVVKKGNDIITNEIPENCFTWQKTNKDGKIVTDWTPNYVDNQKDKIAITKADILERATFDCFLTM